MSQRALTLPIRALSSAPRATLAPKAEHWTCKRCLTTQAQEPAPSLPPTPPSQPTTTSTPPKYDPTLPSRHRSQPLTPSDRLLKRPLNATIPASLLMHVNPALLPGHERSLAENMHKHKEIVGVVVRTGRMDKTVSVRVPGRRWEGRVGKYFTHNSTHLVHDANNSLVVGDVVELHRHRASSAVRHVVAGIVTPFGKGVEEREKILSPEERLAVYKGKRFAKLRRRGLRREAAGGSGEAVAELRRMGVDMGEGRGVDKRRTPTDGAILGKKGQVLPRGVLPGGKHEVGGIGERAKHNKESAMRLREKAEGNLAEAGVVGEELQRKGLRVGGKGEGRDTGL